MPAVWDEPALSEATAIFPNPTLPNELQSLPDCFMNDNRERESCCDCCVVHEREGTHPCLPAPRKPASTLPTPTSTPAHRFPLRTSYFPASLVSPSDNNKSCKTGGQRGHARQKRKIGYMFGLSVPTPPILGAFLFFSCLPSPSRGDTQFVGTTLKGETGALCLCAGCLALFVLDSLQQVVSRF